MRLFADESVVYREIHNYQDHVTLQQDLNNLLEWANQWQLNFNISKWYHLGITNKLAPLSCTYVIDGQLISRVASTKYLGLTISQRLQWNQHCYNLCKKANGTLNPLRRILSDCSRHEV